MALLHLVADGHQNNSMNIPPTLSVDYYTEDFQCSGLSMFLRMSRTHDTKCPEYLEIELNTNIDRNTFKDICHKVCFKMEISGQLVLNIPLRFMMHLKDYEICDNKFYIFIPFQMFCDDIKLVCLDYHDVRITLTDTLNNFMSCKLISKGIYYDTVIRGNMCANSHEHIIQQLASTEINCFQQINEIRYRMPFDGIHKGFFIECTNVDEINEIQLQLNGMERTYYNRFLIRTKCIKINHHLLYFPLNYDKSYTDRTRRGFEGTLNLSRIDSVILKIKLDYLQSKICIYGLGSNILRYNGGMGGSAFTTYDMHHNYEAYNEVRQNISLQTPIETPIQTPIINNNIIYKPITDIDKLSCCITYEDISSNARYMSCGQCHNNFKEESINQWFRQRKSCPMCTSEWSDFTIYCNGEEPVNK